MNTTETITQQALNRYNSLFDNGQYTAIAMMFATDLRSDRESSRVADAMNRVTDTALALCQHPHYELAWLKLATFCGQNAVTIPTIDAIYTYLLIFQQVKDTRADDFEGTSKALLKSYESLDTLRAGVSCANGVHGWRGRMAYELLAAADYLTQAAVQLLMHGNLTYIREKLQSGLRRLTGALYEGIRESDTPAMFNFKATYFPDEHDRR
ncbi:MAG: hypothetical protein K8L99_22370 [Anaerolineae bacterium]|nr:hypothetical protein [Anaerolineae bacterium]